jgi:glucan phosphoethanolaminetransferase (alkaline phosphatase superfamily)
MMLWIIIAVVLALLLFVMLHMEHSLRKVKLIVVIVFFLLVFFSIIGFFASKNNDFDSPRGIFNSVYSYFGWLGEKGIEIFYVGKDSVITVGNIIKSNQTFEKKTDIPDGRK